MDLINALKKIGFTQQEAILYVHLCQSGEITGYEAAKLSGISRSNAYASLSSLVDKGYAHVIEGTASKYVAVPKDELIANARREFEHNINVIGEQLTYVAPSQEPYINLSGEPHILNKLKNIIDASQERIYLSCPGSILMELRDVLKGSIDRGLKVVILSPVAFNYQPHIYYPLERCDSIKLIADTKEVLAGSVGQILYSKNSTLVNIIRETFIHEISIIEMKRGARTVARKEEI
ncbi:TrmB family transcriptional regulator [Anaerotalea alkaliphila]|uniref:TrmB family transcriptional regulator n=1 Tax=Anaerotalea alkaliphila TaxID=2662126 RepID=A0A7X5HXE3_9FIRM|nr:TrmB family transcriptional regulator [Anaerotalea alkaliphila]NDL68428.1 TrmB family transcriptional regulator [Anaerotalea alkaliphila]